MDENTFINVLIKNNFRRVYKFMGVIFFRNKEDSKMFATVDMQAREVNITRGSKLLYTGFKITELIKTVEAL